MGTETRTVITNTGPPLHLSEIGQEKQMALFERLITSQLVSEELSRHNVWAKLGRAGMELKVETVTETQLEILKAETQNKRLSDADLSILFLARLYRDTIVLTDDLALRKILEGEGFFVVGSVGILLRA